MTQEIACYNQAGLLLCSDSLVVQEEASGERAFHSFRKLYPLGSHAAILSAGAKVGIDISQRLERYIAYQRVYDVEDIFVLAQDYLNQQYAQHLEEGKEWYNSHPEAYRRLYFVLGGYAFRDRGNPFRLYLLQSEELELPFRLIPTSNFLTVPRRLGFEMRLVGALGSSSIQAVADLCLGYLRQLGDKEPDRVGGPYYAAIVDEDGFEWYPQRPSST
jgi:hypothetical protein